MSINGSSSRHANATVQQAALDRFNREHGLSEGQGRSAGELYSKGSFRITEYLDNQKKRKVTD